MLVQEKYSLHSFLGYVLFPKQMQTVTPLFSLDPFSFPLVSLWISLATLNKKGMYVNEGHEQILAYDCI